MTTLHELGLDLANAKRQAEWKGSDEIDHSFRAMELAGEVGELCNLLKKLVRIQKGIQGVSEDDTLLRARIADEIGDVIICTSLVANGLGLSTNRCVVDKFNKTSDKHGMSTKL